MQFNPIMQGARAMKTYQELNQEQRAAAFDKCMSETLQAAVELGTQFFPDELQAAADEAGRKADAMQTPWFIHEYLLDVPEIKEHLEAEALETALNAFYPEPGELAVYLPRAAWGV
jgi:hypothetical protein